MSKKINLNDEFDNLTDVQKKKILRLLNKYNAKPNTKEKISVLNDVNVDNIFNEDYDDEEDEDEKPRRKQGKRKGRDYNEDDYDDESDNDDTPLGDPCRKIGPVSTGSRKNEFDYIYRQYGDKLVGEDYTEEDRKYDRLAKNTPRLKQRNTNMRTVHCRDCRKTFTVNKNLIYNGKYRCNRCILDMPRTRD